MMDMSAPLVTVCLPTIGRSTTLVEALESLHQQTYTRLEILLLDNASGAEGQRTLQRFADSNSRARILRSEQRLPMFENFNRGVRMARGEFVAFLFDDDIYLPQLIEREVEALVSHPTAGFVGSNYYLIDETGNVIGLPELVQKTQLVRGREYISGQIVRASMVIGTPGIMYRRELLAAFPFDESLSVYGGDLVMRLRMAEVADVALIDEPLLQIRVHGMSETSQVSPTQSISLRTSLLRDYIAEYTQRWPNDRGFVRFLKWGLARSHFVVVLWDWMTLESDDEANERLGALRVYPVGRLLIPILTIFSRLGLSARRRRVMLAPLLRRLGRVAPKLIGPHRPLT
jgi:glycosyltransferase involved in cell wall biosynthesis